MHKVIIFLSILLMCFPNSVFAKDYVEAADIQKVDIGDTFDEVSKKIGDSQQVLSKTMTDDGKEKVVWLYEAIGRPRRFGGIMGPHPDNQLKTEQAYYLRRHNNPPYLIVFIDGKVSSIERQE